MTVGLCITTTSDMMQKVLPMARLTGAICLGRGTRHGG